MQPFDSTGRERDRGLTALRRLTIAIAMASVALGGWIMSQAAAASSKSTAAAAPTTSTATTAKPLLGPLSPEQLAALPFSLPKSSVQPAPAPLRPAPAPKRVVAVAPPAATTGTS